MFVWCVYEVWFGVMLPLVVVLGGLVCFGSLCTMFIYLLVMVIVCS